MNPEKHLAERLEILRLLENASRLLDRIEDYVASALVSAAIDEVCKVIDTDAPQHPLPVSRAGDAL